MSLILNPVDVGPQVSAVHSNATITTGGSSSFLTYGAKEITLIVNVKAAPTGTAPTITFFLEELDPGDSATTLLTAINTGAINAIGTYAVTLRTTRAGAVRVRWVLGGTSPSFTQVYSTLQQKLPGVALGLDLAGNERPVIVDAKGRLLLGELPTFRALAAGIATGTNKSMLSLLNAAGSGVVVRIHEIWMHNTQTTAVTGVVSLFEGHRITGHSAGTLITPTAQELTDTLSGSVTARTGATIAGEVAAVDQRWRWSSDEWGTGALDQEGYDHALQTLLPHFRAQPPVKPIVLKPGEGYHIKHVTAFGNGSFDLSFVFSQEAA